MLKPLANRKHSVNQSNGSGQNSNVRFKDSTAPVAGMLFGGVTNQTGQKPTNSSNCSGCNR